MAQTKNIRNPPQGYCCSNPNCKRFFSEPEIIKYYVCSSCQSLTKIDGVPKQPVIEEPPKHTNPNLVDFDSIEVQKSKEIEDLKNNIEDKFKEIKKIEKEKSYLNKKLQDVELNLATTKDQIESVSCKLKEKVKILGDVTEKNLELSRRIESLETERASDKIKIREDFSRIKELEKRISEKDDYILNLDKSTGWLREEVRNLTNQRDDVITDKNEAIIKLAQAENKVNQEIEARAKIQFELADLREKMANSIRKESEAAEKSLKDSKRILENEIQSKTMNEEKQLEMPHTLTTIDLPIETPINEIQELKITEIKKEQEKPAKVQELKTAEFKYPKQTIISRTKEEDSESSGGCGFYLGYLAERDKGEAIPSSCVECSKSLDCMLSIVHKSNESVKEIKKWYHFR